MYRHWFSVQAVRPIGRVEVGIPLHFHDHGTRSGWGVSVTPPAALYPRERLGTHCTGGWVGSRGGPDSCWKSRLHRDSNPDRPALSHSLYPTKLPGQCNTLYVRYILFSHSTDCVVSVPLWRARRLPGWKSLCQSTSFDSCSCGKTHEIPTFLNYCIIFQTHSLNLLLDCG
jgi:hypothetical protein